MEKLLGRGGGGEMANDELFRENVFLYSNLILIYQCVLFPLLTERAKGIEDRPVSQVKEDRWLAHTVIQCVSCNELDQLFDCSRVWSLCYELKLLG